MSAACTVALAATVYRWVDENGVTHYSDQPHENAEKVHIAAPQTYTAPPVTNRSSSSSGSSSSATSAPSGPRTYQNCTVVSPSADQNFPNTDSVPTVTDISPAPHDGDKAALFFDGMIQPNYPIAGGSYTISAVNRGTHTVMVVVEDVGGRILCQSPSVSFSVTQPSVLNPANPNFKH